MFAIFDLTASLWLGIAATISGLIASIWARRRLANRSAS
jgi:hypothetical protein